MSWDGIHTHHLYRIPNCHSCRSTPVKGRRCLSNGCFCKGCPGGHAGHTMSTQCCPQHCCMSFVNAFSGKRRRGRSDCHGLRKRPHTCGALESESDGKEEKLYASQQQQACVTEPVRCHLQCHTGRSTSGHIDCSSVTGLRHLSMAFNVHFVLCSMFPVGELLTTCKGSRTSKLQYVRDLGEEQGDLYANTALLSDLYQKLGFM